MSAAPLLRFNDAPTAGDLRQLAQLEQQHAQLFRDLEMSPPTPGPTERPAAYRVRVLSALQRHSDKWLRADLARLPTDVVARIAPEIIADATAVAADPTTGSFRHPGQLRTLRRTDQSGNEDISYCGSPNTWMQTFMAPSVACVKVFNTGRR